MTTSNLQTTAQPRPGDPRGRDGFVLAAAVFGLLVVIILVTGGFFLARQEFRVGMANDQASEAFFMTEAQLAEVAGPGWNLFRYRNLELWTPETVMDTVGLGEVTTQITRMADRMFFLDASGEVTQTGVYAGASRRMGRAFRLFVPDIDPPAALTTRGRTTIRGTAEVHGEDEIPREWRDVCDPFHKAQDKTGILSNDTSLVELGSAVSKYTGNPPLDEDPTMTDDTFRQFGELNWDDLVSLADKRVATGGSISVSSAEPVFNGDGSCNRAAPYNWGDPENPTGPCGAYFPVVHVDGDITIQSGGVGQGLLLVDGTLDLRGEFVWFGVIIVQGTFETQGNGNRVYGAVLASNAEFDSQSLVGGSVVSNSTCATTRAIELNNSLTRLIPLTNRSWVDLSGLMN